MSNYRLDYNEPENEHDNPHDVSLEHLDEIIYGGKPAALKQVTWDDLTKELQHALLATSRDEEIKFVEAEYLYDNGLIAYKPPTMIGVSRYRLTPAGRALLPAPTLTPQALGAAIYGTSEYWQQMNSASIEAHTETLERVKVLEAENARLRDVMIEALAFARTGLIPMEFEPYVFDGETRRLHWNEHMRIQIAKLIDAALK